MILAAFRVRSFRFQWPADLLTAWAFEMETLILGWYVMIHTGSVLLLTAFGSLQFLGTLAAPMFGVLGDGLGGRLMLCAMRATYAMLAALAHAHRIPVCGHVVPEIQVHLLSAVPNGHMVEYVPRSAGILTGMPRLENGELVAPQAPGLGLELEETAVRRYRVAE